MSFGNRSGASKGDDRNNRQYQGNRGELNGVSKNTSLCISHTLERSIKIVALEGSQHKEIRATNKPTIPESVSKNEELRPITTFFINQHFLMEQAHVCHLLEVW